MPPAKKNVNSKFSSVVTRLIVIALPCNKSSYFLCHFSKTLIKMDTT